MNQEKLNRAFRALEIQDVVQRSCIAQLSQEHSPNGECPDNIEIQYKHNVIRSEVLEPVDADQQATYLFRVFIDLGVRWRDSESVEAPQAQPQDPGDETASTDFLGFIEASYVCEYKLTDKELEQTVLDEFALNNASYHVWPYFREFVSSQCGRMAAPRITMPMVQFANNRHQSSAASSDDLESK